MKQIAKYQSRAGLYVQFVRRHRGEMTEGHKHAKEFMKDQINDLYREIVGGNAILIGVQKVTQFIAALLNREGEEMIILAAVLGRLGLGEEEAR